MFIKKMTHLLPPTIRSSFLLIFLIFFLSIKLVGTIAFNGKTPPNSYIVPVTLGDVVVASANWSSTATDLDLHIFQPGRVISDSTSDKCQCFCCSSSQTVTLTANANGNIVVWAQQWGGAGVQYNLVITKNGATFATDNTFLSQNASFHKQSVTSVPCTMFINFTSTGSFSLNFYAPNTLMSGSPMKTFSYTGGSGYKDVTVPVTVSGDYDLKVIGNPANPSGGWSSFIYYSGSMECKSCSVFMTGCLTCTSSIVCTSCSTGFTLSGGKCLCSVTNCQNCSSASTCGTCVSGYYVNASQQCPSCSVITGCISCTNNTFCTLCAGANFFNTSLKLCRPCGEAIPGCIDCDNQTVCLQCTLDKYFDGTSCVSCGLTLTNCQQCITPTACTQCQNITFLNSSSSLCQLCSSTITGCSTCSDSATCTSCDINHILASPSCVSCSSFIAQCLNCTTVSSQVQCLLCSPGFFLNPITHVCIPCNQSVSNCDFCDSQNQCTYCQSPLYYLKSPSTCDTCQTILLYCLKCSNDGKTCIQCLDDRYLLENDKCYTCSKYIPNCLNCKDTLNCLECNVKYHLNPIIGGVGCKSCQLSMEGCSQCDSATFCTSVVNDSYFVHPTNNTVAKCNTQIPHCLTCSTGSICTLCQTAYFLQNGACILCLDAIPYCSQCSNSSVCQQCEADFKPYLPSGNCTCKVGLYFLNACISGDGCINAFRFNSSLTACIMCNADQHFVYDSQNKTCKCDRGYALKNGDCVGECGNGFHFEEECDDGNVLSYDGCSFDCKVEAEYVCLGSKSERSRCLIKISPQIRYLYTIRTDGQNKGMHYFIIQPPSQLYYRVNFTELIGIDDSRMALLGARYIDGRIQVQFQFNQSCQDQLFTIKWKLTNAFNSINTISLEFSTQPMRPPLDMLEYKLFFDVVFWFGEILAYLLLTLLVFNMFFHKMIGIELLMVYQIIYVTGCLSFKNVSVYRVLTSLRPIMGISNILKGSTIDLINPQVLRFLSVGRSLLVSMNISLGIYFLVLIPFVVMLMHLWRLKLELKKLNLITVRLQKKIEEEMKFKWQKMLSEMEQKKLDVKNSVFHSNKRVEFVYERLLYPVGVFILLPIIVMYGVMIIGSIRGEPRMIEELSYMLFKVVLFLSGMLFCHEVRRFTAQYKEGDPKVSFRSITDCLSNGQYHKYSGLFMMFGIFCVLMTIGGILSLDRVGIFLILFCTILLLVNLKCYRPYLENYHNKILLYNYSILLFHLMILLIDSYSKISELTLLILLLFIFVCGYVAVVLSLYRIFLQSKQITKHNIKNDVKAPERINFKETLKFNPYVYHEEQNSGEDLIIDPKANSPFLFDRREKKIGHIEFFPPEDNDGEVVSELQKIKRKLRKQIKYMKTTQIQEPFIFQS